MQKMIEHPRRSASATARGTDAARRPGHGSAGVQPSEPMPAESSSDSEFDETDDQGPEPALESML